MRQENDSGGVSRIHLIYHITSGSQTLLTNSDTFNPIYLKHVITTPPILKEVCLILSSSSSPLQDYS